MNRNKLNEFIFYAANIYYRDEDIYSIIQRAGMKAAFIPYASRPVTFWSNIIEHAKDKTEGLKNLVKAMLEDGHEDDAYLKAFYENQDTDFRNAFSGEADGGKPEIDKKQLEKLTKGKSTLLPVSFLQLGVNASRKVVHIETEASYGTGFLLKNNYLLTNNHVIPDKDMALTAKILFNYELPEPGVTVLPAETCRLDPDSANGFATSISHDWTVVKLKDFTAEQAKAYGYLELKEVKVKPDDFVNIIQHPEGRHKQIALYHNMVVMANDSRIQYLTDTLKGSSGSPVFNSQWEVVALHHAGFETSIGGAKQIVNEGININLVINEMAGKGINLQ
jgi:V8-like Glu-specific endopeptidase